MGEDPNAIRADIERTRAEMGDTVDALGYKADVKSRAKDKISDTKDRITGKVSDVTPDGQQVKRAAGVAQENPLGLALGGVAVGFIAGMLVPSSRVEDEKIGPMADQVKDQLKETGQEAFERGKDVAQQAAESAKETAQEAGQHHAEELRDSTQERAQTVTPR
jgi:gas vesicle protein